MLLPRPHKDLARPLGGGRIDPEHADGVENDLEHLQESAQRGSCDTNPCVCVMHTQVPGDDQRVPPPSKINDLPCQHLQEVATALELC